VENIYIILQQIYSANGVPNFIRITLDFLEDITKKYVGLFFLYYSTAEQFVCSRVFLNILRFFLQ